MKKLTLIIKLLIFAAPAIYVLSIWNRLTGPLPLHYNIEGEADRFGTRTELLMLVIVLTAINLGVYLLLINIHKIDKRKQAHQAKDQLGRIATAITVFISAIACLVIYSSSNAINSLDKIPGFIFSCIGFLLSIVGNFLYNIKPNYFAGFRVSWTLNNEDNWRKTHHMAGKLWFAGGLVIAITCLFLNFKTAFIVFLAITFLMIIIPIVYSYSLHRNRHVSNGA